MQKPLTEKRLENIALFYLERFDAPATKLRQVLLRRVRRQKMQDIPVDENINIWIENVIQKCQDLGYVNDTRYVQNTVRRLSESGKSAHFILQKLSAEGLDSELAQPFLDEGSDLQRAQLFVKKKHLGKDFQKDLAKLARAGFDYETAKAALNSGATP